MLQRLITPEDITMTPSGRRGFRRVTEEGVCCLAYSRNSYVNGAQKVIERDPLHVDAVKDIPPDLTTETAVRTHRSFTL